MMFDLMSCAREKTISFVTKTVKFKHIPKYSNKNITSPIRKRKITSGLYCVGFALLAALNISANAQFPTGDQISPGDLKPQPSMDTTLIKAKVGSVSYAIPRNYISNLRLGFPRLTVTYPGLKPLSPETAPCFDRKIQNKFNCTTIDLRLRLEWNNEKVFNNFLNHFPNIRPRKGPLNYVIYDLGPENARIEFYRDASANIFFPCNIFDNAGQKDAVCDDAISLNDGNAVRVFLEYDKIEEIPHIEKSIRELMNKFVDKGQ